MLFDDQNVLTDEKKRRQRRLGVFATAAAHDFAAAWDALGTSPVPTDSALFALAREPEMGLVMTKGRAGGDGAPFAMGEATVSRCVVGFEGSQGTTLLGVGYLLGRDPARAYRIACLDALAQDPAHTETVDRLVTEPLAGTVAQQQRRRAEMAGGTRVSFTTMVRGD